MSIEEIIELTNNKLKYLQANRVLAFNRGDLEVFENLDASILLTEDTLRRLQTLL